MQLSEKHKDKVLRMSCDNKNKLNVGVVATSRKQKIRRFFPTNDAPNYPDHDFPYPNAKLIPAGYKVLHDRPSRSRSAERYVPGKKSIRDRTRSLSPVSRNDILDKKGRKVIKWPRNGPMELYIYAQRFVCIKKGFLIRY